MGYSRFDPAMQRRVAWNAGKNVGTKRPLTQKQIWAIRFHLDREGRLRDKALFDLAIDSKLRGCDLVKIKIGDVVAGADIRNRAIVIQQKTNRPVQFELTADVRATLLAWLERRGGSTGDYLFPSRVDHAGHMSTRQYARLVDEWVTAIGLRKSEYGTHSLRRTKAAMIYRATGNIRAIQILLGTPRSRTRSAISVSMSKTLSSWQSARKSDPSGARPMVLVGRFRLSATHGRAAGMRVGSGRRDDNVVRRVHSRTAD